MFTAAGGTAPCGGQATCLDPNTNILLPNYSQKKIKNLKAGDLIMSYDPEYKSFDTDKIIEIKSTLHTHLYTLTLEDNISIRLTAEHPIKLNEDKWGSLRTSQTKLDYPYCKEVVGLMNGMEVETIFGFKKIINISEVDFEEKLTYNILKLEMNRYYFANNILTITEEKDGITQRN